MAKNNRNLKVVYPDEKEERAKDANRKLRSQIKILNKKLKRLESENRTLNRAFNKSCDFIQNKFKDKNLKEILEKMKDFDYKETENGREREAKKETEKDRCMIEECIRCGNSTNEGYKVIDFGKFKVENCKCGYRSRIEVCEGNSRS